MDSDSEWQPPTEAEMKLIEARRERSDKVSKLMSSYLLKGFKMLGTICSICDTILLQDSQGINFCVACSELGSDTDKDNPVTNQSAALSMAREIKLASGSSPLLSSLPSSQQKTPSPITSFRKKSTNVTATSPSTTGSESRTSELLQQPNCPYTNPDSNYDHNGTQTLSMSSIDVQSWPPFDSDRRSGEQSSAADPRYSDLSVKLDHLINVNDSSDSGFLSTAHLSPPSQRSAGSQLNTTGTSITSSLPANMMVPSTSIIAGLCEKMEWASKELKATSSVGYSSELCNLIKSAADAVLAVKNARN